ncbi:MAG: IMP dehydrogenase [Candidatus Aenigmarchaeota archaeon]|nr:IMP dehydrogenase [Candidatus Aenigmarchaeota archaeon]
MTRIVFHALSFDDVLLVPKKSFLSSRSEVELSTELTKNIKINTPLVSAAMDTVTEDRMAISMSLYGGLGVIHRFQPIESQVEQVKNVKDFEFNKTQFPNANLDKNNKLMVGAAIGVKNNFLERAAKLIEADADFIVIDVAHGHMQKVIDAIKEVKRNFDIDLIVGNVATYEAAKDLAEVEADCIKIGIGPGSACTTRIVTGFGIPIFSSILDCAKIKEEYDITLMADGGMRNSGDIVKALAAGASAIMSGFLFSGVDETPGSVIEIEGKKYKLYKGMFSLESNRKLAALENRPFNEDIAPEGVEGLVAYKGSLSKVLFKLLNGIRNGLSYCGARNIKELQEKAEFITITVNGLRESHAHDIMLFNDFKLENFDAFFRKSSTNFQ